MLHELRIWAIEHDILSKDRRRERRIDLLRREIAELAIQDEVVSIGTQTDGRWLSEQDEREDVSILARFSLARAKTSQQQTAHLFLAIKEKLERVHSV